MAPKKVPKNGYFYFMMEFQKMERAKGKNISIADASNLASESWKKLSDVEKERYKQIAQKKKENNKIVVGPEKTQTACQTNLADIYTSQGVPLSMVMAEEKRKQDEVNVAKDIVRKMLIDGKRGFGIDKVTFSFIHMNMFIENYPCEVAVSKFSIYNGIIDTYHSLIKVKSLPLGTAYEAKQQSEKGHGLPVPPHAIGNDDHFSILYDIKTFAKSSNNRKTILFCHPRDMEALQSGLEFLDGGCETVFENFMLIDIVELFHQMHQMIFKGLPLGDITYAAAKVVLERDTFDSLVKGCKNHDELDLNVVCSQAITKRLSYQYLDTFARTLGISLKPAHHFPHNQTLNSVSDTEGTELESLIHDFHFGTSDETSSNYESDPQPKLKQKVNLNETNPFNLYDCKKFGARPKQTNVVQSGEKEQISESDFEVDSEFDGQTTTYVTDMSDDESTMNLSFQAAKFKKLLQDVRDGNC